MSSGSFLAMCEVLGQTVGGDAYLLGIPPVPTAIGDAVENSFCEVLSAIGTA